VKTKRDATPAALDKVDCALNEEYSASATALFAASSVLASGLIRLPQGQQVGLQNDNRLPSQGGRKFNSEIRNARDIIEARLGEGRVRSITELLEMVQADGNAQGHLTAPPPHAYHLAPFSPAIDAGPPDSTRTRDAVGNPIYGIPDIVMMEFQRTLSIQSDPLPVNTSLRLYDDGSVRLLTPTDQVQQAALSMSPMSGYLATDASGARARLLDLEILNWTGTQRSWWIEGEPQSWCQRISDLIP